MDMLFSSSYESFIAVNFQRRLLVAQLDLFAIEIRKLY